MNINPSEFSSEGGESGAPREQPAGISTTRRKLVKSGAFAPPVILTLRSGSVMAQTSAATCLATSREDAQQRANTDPNFDATSTEDGFLRAPIRIRKVRRVRRRKGKYLAWGSKVYDVYTHHTNTGKPWTSLKPGKRGKKFKLEDEGQEIQVYDAKGEKLLMSGRLMHRRGYPRRRFAGLQEEDSYGLVQTNSNGEVLVDPETNEALVGAVVSPTDPAQPQNVSASCWASLGVTSASAEI